MTVGWDRTVTGPVRPSPVLTAAVVVIAGLSVVLGTAYLLPKIAHWKLAPDFTIMWAAGRFALEGAPMYDAEALTAAQTMRRPPGLLPFAYPPSALWLFAPFALLPFWPAFWLWTAISLAAFWAAARRVASGWPLLLALASPNVLWAVGLGQTALLVGAAVLAGLLLLRDKPLFAGIFLGIAVAIKPQCVLLAPVAFVAGRHWQAFAGAAIGLAAAVLLALPFGASLWLDWFSSLGEFRQIVGGYGIEIDGATPAMAAQVLGLPALPFQAAGIAAGIWLVWRGFRSDDLHTRIVTFVCGSLLAAPYAIRYELVTLAPVAATALLSATWRGLLVGLPLVAVNVLVAVPAMLASAAAQLSSRSRENAAHDN